MKRDDDDPLFAMNDATEALLRGLSKEWTELRAALVLILPLAKAYAAAHPVGSNAQYVADAAVLLRRLAEQECDA